MKGRRFINNDILGFFKKIVGVYVYLYRGLKLLGKYFFLFRVFNEYFSGFFLDIWLVFKDYVMLEK